MAYLQIYDWEQTVYAPFRDMKLTHDETRKYLNKLERHFKTPHVELMTGKRNGGSYHPVSLGTPYIRIPGRGTNLGTVCHEFAHHLDWVKNRNSKNRGAKRWHGKTFKKCLVRVYRWAKRWLPIEMIDFVPKKYVPPPAYAQTGYAHRCKWEPQAVVGQLQRHG